MDFQDQLSKAQLEAQERDRSRIAADLHDSVGSLLWAAKLQASLIERSMALNPSARESHDELVRILDQTIQAVRRISSELTPEGFLHVGLAESIERLCQSLDGQGVAVTFRADQPPLWNDGRALQAFRIVQELLRNSVTHARANHIVVSLSNPGNTLLLVVEDDGIGYQPQPATDGVGWWSLRQRARQLDAEISAEPSPGGKGLSVTVAIPFAS